MKLPQSVGEVLREHVVLENESIDRMYLNVYVPQLQRIGGVVWYLRGHLGQRFASTVAIAPKTEQFVAAIEKFAKRRGVDVVSFRKDPALWSSHPTSPPGLTTAATLFFPESSLCEPVEPYTASRDPTP
jgi:hypothetical protein